MTLVYILLAITAILCIILMIAVSRDGSRAAYGKAKEDLFPTNEAMDVEYRKMYDAARKPQD